MSFAVLAVTAAMLHPSTAAARPAPGTPPAQQSGRNAASSTQPQVRTPLGPGTAAQPAAQRHGVVPGQVVVTFGAGTSVTGRGSSTGRTSARTPATDNAAVNQALGKVGALSLRPVLGATGQAASAARGTAAPAADSALPRTYVVQTSDRDSAAVAKRLRTTPGIAAAEPDRYVNTLAVPGQQLPAAALKAASAAARAQAAQRTNITPGGASGSAIPANYALADSAQALLNAGGVDAAGSFALLKGAYGQDPGAGEIITNVSLGDLVDASMVGDGNPEAVDSGATTILQDGQRYLDLPSMPLIPTYVSDGQGGLSGTASVQGQDPALDEVLLDFSVMSPLPHDEQRPDRVGAGYTDLLGIAPGAKYRLVVPQTPTIDQIAAALMAAADQTPHPNVITASLGMGDDAFGFASRYLEDDPVIRAAVRQIVRRGIVVVISSNDGTRLFTHAAVGPDGGSTATELAPGESAATDPDDVAFSGADSRDPDTGAIAAGGTTLDDTLSAPDGDPTVAETRVSGFGTFSSGFGSRVDLSAPSDNIPAFVHPTRTAFAPAGGPSDVNVALNGGTSASAPEIAAAAAVVLQGARLAGHSMTPADVRSLLERTGRQVATPAQIDRTLHVGPQIDVTAATQAALGGRSAAEPALVRLSVAHHVMIGGLGGTFTETTDPNRIDLGDVASGGTGEGLAGPVTVAGDVVGVPAGAHPQYRLTEGTTVWRSDSPGIRVTPRQLLSAAHLPIVSASDRDVRLRYDVLVGGRVVATASRTLTIGPSDGTYDVAPAPTGPAVAALGHPVTVHYDLTGVRGLSRPAIAVSGVGHWNPLLAPMFDPAWTLPLTGGSGTVTIPADAFHGGSGIYGIGIVMATGNALTNVYGDFAPIRLGTGTAAARAATPLLTDSSGVPAHQAEVSRAHPEVRVGYDVRGVPGATGAEVEFSAPGPTQNGPYEKYSSFNNPNGSQPDDDGIDAPSTLHVTLPGTTGNPRLSLVDLGLPTSEYYNVRVLATDSRHRVVGQASPAVELEADDGLAPDGDEIADFAVAGKDSLVSLLGADGSVALRPYDPATGTYGPALATDGPGASYAVLGASSDSHRALVAHRGSPDGDVDLQVWDTAGRSVVARQTLPAGDLRFMNGQVDTARNRGVVLVQRKSDQSYALLSLDLATGAASAQIPIPVAGAGITDPGAAPVQWSEMAIDPTDGSVVVLPTGPVKCAGQVNAPRIDLATGAVTLAGTTARCSHGLGIDDTGTPYNASNSGFSVTLPMPSLITKLDPADDSPDPVTVRQDRGFELKIDGQRDLALEKFNGPEGVRYPGLPAVVFDNDAMGQTLVVDLATGERVKTVIGTVAYDDGSPLMAFPMPPTTASLDSTSMQLDVSQRTAYSIGWNRQQIQQFSY
ncbi:S8 family serine peptidase [Actinacidiphila acidipaludis]|uniref:S8 family serine peptidase n=1 Tax=Actinacidiphila acidipaludis TaxID=2873382 RepID=A0ABS7Q317_9ACTN|nr:S8 family serine peptidase [Streptomyces acidipaludis]MBY8877246.1 S8 family serine peptidase [Streptomyces acidipaludis]